MPMRDKVDVCVVGGGIAGLFTALYAVKSGLSVRLVDKVYIGGSRFNIGAVMHQGHVEAEQQFLQHSFNIWEKYADDLGFERRGSLQMAYTASEVKSAQAEAKAAKKAGVASTFHTDSIALGKELGGVELPEEVLAIRQMSSDGLVESATALDALRRQFIQAGGRVWGSDKVAEVLREGHKVIGVRTQSGEECHAGTTVVLAGAWSGFLLNPLGVKIPLRPARAHVLQLSVSKTLPTQMLMRQYKTGRLVAKYQPQQGRVLAAYDGLMDQAQATMQHEADPEAVDWMRRQLPTLLPILSIAELKLANTVTLAVTPDFIPCLGPWPELEGLLIGVGWNGKDYSYAPAVGDAFSYLLQGKESPLDLVPFNPARFAK